MKSSKGQMRFIVGGTVASRSTTGKYLMTAEGRTWQQNFAKYRGKRRVLECGTANRWFNCKAAAHWISFFPRYFPVVTVILPSILSVTSEALWIVIFYAINYFSGIEPLITARIRRYDSGYGCALPAPLAVKLPNGISNDHPLRGMLLPVVATRLLIIGDRTLFRDFERLSKFSAESCQCSLPKS